MMITTVMMMITVNDYDDDNIDDDDDDDDNIDDCAETEAAREARLSGRQDSHDDHQHDLYGDGPPVVDCPTQLTLFYLKICICIVSCVP